MMSGDTLTWKNSQICVICSSNMHKLQAIFCSHTGHILCRTLNISVFNTVGGTKLHGLWMIYFMLCYQFFCVLYHIKVFVFHYQWHFNHTWQDASIKLQLTGKDPICLTIVDNVGHETHMTSCKPDLIFYVNSLQNIINIHDLWLYASWTF